MVGNGAVRAIQADELVEGPAKARIPIVLVGDLNSNVPGVKPGDEKAFQRILAAGFRRRSTQEPPSCCIQDDTGGTLADFDHVVDHILAKPGRKVRLVSSSVVGRTKVQRIVPVRSRRRVQRPAGAAQAGAAPLAIRIELDRSAATSTVRRKRRPSKCTTNASA